MHFFDQSTKAAIDRAVNLPGFFSDREKLRSFRTCKFIVSETANQLREKHQFLAQNGWDKGLDISDVESEMRKGYIRVLHQGDGRPILYFLRRNFVPRAKTAKLQMADETGMTKDKSSSLEDALRCVIYCMELAVKEMEDLPTDQDGFFAILDFEGCGVKNFEFPNHTIDRKIFSTLSNFYPETVHKMFVANADSIVIQGVSQLAKSLLPQTTREKLEVLPPNKKDAIDMLVEHIPRDSLPRSVGGLAEYESVEDYIVHQAELEDIDLDEIHRKRALESEELMEGDGLVLNGMQYSGMSAEKVLSYKVSLRGSLWWFKNEGASEIQGRKLNILAKLGLGWSQMFVLLRPDVCLVYDSPSSQNPSIIVPLAEVEVRNIKIDSQPRGTFAFTMSVPGSPRYVLATKSEQERALWLQGIEEGKSSCAQRQDERDWAEEEHARMNGDLLGLEDDNNANIVLGQLDSHFDFSQNGNSQSNVPLMDFWSSPQQTQSQSSSQSASVPTQTRQVNLSLLSDNQSQVVPGVTTVQQVQQQQPQVTHVQQPQVTHVQQSQVARVQQPQVTHVQQPQVTQIQQPQVAQIQQPQVTQVQQPQVTQIQQPQVTQIQQPQVTQIHPTQPTNGLQQTNMPLTNGQQPPVSGVIDDVFGSLATPTANTSTVPLSSVQSLTGAMQNASIGNLARTVTNQPNGNSIAAPAGATHTQGATPTMSNTLQTPGAVPATNASHGATVQFFPAGVTGTPEYGQHWTSLGSVATVQVAKRPDVEATRSIETIWRSLNVQHVETLSPVAGREFYEAILAGRSSQDGSLCLLHCKIGSQQVTVTAKSSNDQLCANVTQKCVFQFSNGV